MSSSATYPEAPGYKAATPKTSREAAEAVASAAAIVRERVLAMLSVFPDATPDEAAAFLSVDKLSVRPRFSELSLAGKIEDTGRRRKNASGKNAAAWRLVRRLGQMTLL